MLRTAYHRVRRYMPAASVWLFLLAIVSAFLHLGFVVNTRFADAFNEGPAAAVRAVFAHLTGWIPFSLAETLILAVPMLFVAALVVCIRNAGLSWRRAGYCILSLVSVLALLYSMFVWTFAAGYRASTLDRKLGIADEEVSAVQLATAAAILADEMEYLMPEITFRHNNASVMPYDYTELSRRLMTAYDVVCDGCPFLQRLDSRVKPVALSEPWTYTHISGVYTMFTGEANINVNFPDYVIPYTAAHELAHQRGIARENEANFVAFLVCLSSDDPYIRYSGCLNMYEYIMSALYSASPEYYSMVQSSLDLRIRYEQYAYSVFFDRYRETVVSEVSEAVNNTYLVMQGTDGTKSYGMVVDLAVAYAASLNKAAD